MLHYLYKKYIFLLSYIAIKLKCYCITSVLQLERQRLVVLLKILEGNREVAKSEQILEATQFSSLRTEL